MNVTSEHDESLPELKQIKPNKDLAAKPWFKRKNIIIPAAIALIVMCLGLVLLYTARAKTDKSEISDGWHAIVQESNKLTTMGKELKTTDDFSDYSKELHSFDALLNDKKYNAGKLPTVLARGNDVAIYKDALNKLSEYVARTAAESDTVSQFTTDDYDAVKSLANHAKDATTALKSKLTYLSEDIPAQVFDIANILDTAKTNIDTKRTEEQAAKDKAAAQTAQDNVDKATVEKNITTYEVAFIAADAAKMKTVMTAGFIGEYDFSTLSTTNRQYSYPNSYRIIDTKKQDDGSYVVRVNVVYKTRDDMGNVTGQYTQTYTETVVSSNGKWLINAEKALY